MADDVFSGINNIFTKMGTAYDRDLRGVTSPFRNEVIPENVKSDKPAEKSGKLSRKNNSFDIMSYQWYTSDIERRYSDDYYNNIAVDFAVNASAKSKGIKGAITDVVNEAGGVVNSAFNTVIDSANQISSGVNNLLGGTSNKQKAADLNKKIIQEKFEYFIKSFPFAKVYEFKPQDTLGANISTMTTMFKLIDTIVDSNSPGGAIMKDMLNGLNSWLVKEFKLDIYDPSTFTNPDTRIMGFPNKMYKNLISGYYTGYYEIPAITYDDFLDSRGSDGWTKQGFTDRFFGSAASTVKNFMSDNIGSGFDIATRPKWSIDGGGDGRDNISFKATLFNDNLNSVFNNLAFIHSFVAGNLWYQDTIIQKCSSLYDVEVPGRFRYYFCTCDVSVKFIGKVRKINNRAALWNNTSMNFNLEVLNNIPDAYDITFNFKSLIPNNYNSYIAYILNEDINNITVGQRVDTLMQDMANKVNAAVKTGEDLRVKQKAEATKNPTAG